MKHWRQWRVIQCESFLSTIPMAANVKVSFLSLGIVVLTSVPREHLQRFCQQVVQDVQSYLRSGDEVTALNMRFLSERNTYGDYAEQVSKQIDARFRHDLRHFYALFGQAQGKTVAQATLQPQGKMDTSVQAGKIEFIDVNLPIPPYRNAVRPVLLTIEWE